MLLLFVAPIVAVYFEVTQLEAEPNPNLHSCLALKGLMDGWGSECLELRWNPVVSSIMSIIL